jgi:exonuclease III
MLELNDAIDQIDLTDTYRVFHPETAQYTFSAAHGTFSKIDHILDHKESLSKYKKMEKTPCILSGHSGRKLEFKNKSNNHQ